jgi:hypothetical protein
MSCRKVLGELCMNLDDHCGELAAQLTESFITSEVKNACRSCEFSDVAGV